MLFINNYIPIITIFTLFSVFSIFTLFTFVFSSSSSSFNINYDCSVTQIHIAQGLTPSSMTISWVTKDDCLSRVAYGKDTKQLDNYMYGSSAIYNFTFIQESGLNNSNIFYYQSSFIHHVSLENLKSDTQYFYACFNDNDNGNGNDNSKNINQFKTLPRPGNNKILTFGVIGDLGQTTYSVSNINQILNNRHISMVLNTGDLSYADCQQNLWDTYGEIIEPLAKSIPWMICAGNHEIEFNGTDYSRLFTAFEARYRMPSLKPAEFGKVAIKSDINPATGLPFCCPSIFQAEYNYGNSFFSFESGLAHIIYLNPYTSTNTSSIQYNWLQNNLEYVDRDITPWIIIVMHCPWYSSNVNHFNETQTFMMREAMEYLFLKYRVNIVFSGHVHAYERTYPVFENKLYKTGPVYITIGDGGNIEVLASDYFVKPEWSAYRNGTQYGYGTLTIFDKKMILWKWYKSTGILKENQVLPRDELLLCNSVFGDTKCV